MDRLNYLLRRLALAVPTFLGITLLCFGLTRALPGGPVEQAILRMRGIGSGEAGGGGEQVRAVSESYRRALEKKYGFDRPFLVQYANWLWRDRMGLRLVSDRYPESTSWELIRSRIPISLWFGLTGFVLSYLICIPLGIAKALRHGTRFDAISSLLVFAAYAAPAFALGMVLKLLFTGVHENFWSFFPPGGIASENAAQLTGWERFLDRAHHMILPVTCYVAGSFAVLTLFMKNSLLEQLGSDYVRTVLAKGASRAAAVWRHALRNALVPIATGFGSILTVIFAGSVIIEQIFEIPGMGRLGLEAIEGRDYTLFMANFSLTAIMILLGNLLSDFSYMLIDPRIHFNR